jgi:YfiH family protein
MIALALLAHSGVRHAYFTRRGGVSEGLFHSLNCGFASGDSEARVAENRAIAMERLGARGGRLVTCRQVHGDRVVTVTDPWGRENAPRADAMVTRVGGLALGVLAADCAPLLFADPVAGIVGAAHCGWRGALSGVAEATVAAMAALGAEQMRIRAGIGPCIGPASYEVGPEFPRPILAEDAGALAYFAPAPQPGRSLFDLAGYIAHRLRRCGVAAVERAAHDTAAEARDFFSYRRAHRRGEPAYGRGLSAIMLEA